MTPVLLHGQLSICTCWGGCGSTGAWLSVGGLAAITDLGQEFKLNDYFHFSVQVETNQNLYPLLSFGVESMSEAPESGSRAARTHGAAEGGGTAGEVAGVARGSLSKRRARG